MVLKREIGSGKVIDYDGSFGSIKDNNQNEYLFSKDDILDKKDIKIGGIVTFEKEIQKNIEVPPVKRARFVRCQKKAKTLNL